jgi:hypothetical protein
MRQKFAYLSSWKRGDLAILLLDSNYLIYQDSRQPRSQAVADIKMVPLVNSHGTWAPATSTRKDKIGNPSLVQQEQIKTESMPISMSQSALLSLRLWFLFWFLWSNSGSLLVLSC